MTIEPTNLTAQLHYRAAGNPPSTLPDAAISNCYPGLEFDIRNLWRRLLEGIELHEASGLVVSSQREGLEGLYLLEVAGHPTRLNLIAPSGQVVRRDFMEWSNALAEVVAQHSGELVRCVFDADPQADAGSRTEELRVRPIFVPSATTQSATALIAEAVAQPGELTQSLCSPWQNDYQECGCWYWAASRPDYVNIESTATGSVGDRWLADPAQPKTYDVASYTHEQLFRSWEQLLRFIVEGRYYEPPPV